MEIAIMTCLFTKWNMKINTSQTNYNFNILMQRLEAASYDQYEISNFAKPGFRSRHNSSYWQGKNYLGIGPSAHSFNSESRQWNIANNALYIAALQKGELNFEKEVLTISQQMNEYIMTSLRTMEGVDLEFIGEKWGNEALEKLKIGAMKYLKEGKARIQEEKLQLTAEGKFLADGIAADLFFD